MLFSSIPGLSDVKNKIVQAVKNNHLAHALLFHGPEGSANLKMALSLATYLHCHNPGEEDACGECASCQKMAKLVHPDMNFAFPMPGEVKEDEEEKKKKVDVVGSFRNFAIQNGYGNISDWIYQNDFEKKQLNISKGAARQVIRTLSLKSFEGGYKIMMIWCPEFLNTASANSLLKILEEPPEKTVFLLVTSQPEQLLTTILSRTQKIMVRAFSDEEIMDHLVSEDLCSREAAVQIAPLADGNMREAYRLIDQVQDENTALIRDWFRACYTVDINQIFDFVDKFSTRDKEAQKSLLLSGANVLREVMLDKAQIPNLMRSADTDRQFIHNLGVHVLDGEKISRIYELINQAYYHLERNANMKVLFGDLSFQIARVMKPKQTASR
ncbi:DNA polymerase III delta prime subunit [Indibacter alkaliphilus LW1]|uniref:DNA polymerase III delta prime subunit n=1 Tax=Indibacter alkaliphilus (strain CCUG 57479 / KCTC 22604 / LW1) TaxID=1189612 RepID=S2EA04_INDAL|nr:DNA polymerase III subunit gamma/tau [Indibacter alkaliphilus]EOZ99143.1 DNA polymerase III delta prime subunit [Indibacter alkaliphilus LW1]